MMVLVILCIWALYFICKQKFQIFVKHHDSHWKPKHQENTVHISRHLLHEKRKDFISPVNTNGPGYDRDNYGKLEEHKTHLLFKNNGYIQGCRGVRQAKKGQQGLQTSLSSFKRFPFPNPENESVYISVYANVSNTVLIFS